MDLDLENRREANRLRKAIADANNEVAREKARYDYEKYIANLQFKRQEGDKNRKNRIQAAGIRASNSKEEKSIKVQTRSGNVYTLQPHEFNSFRNQVYNNPENYPSLFDREEIVREQKNNLGRMEKVPTGEYKYKLKSGADDNAMAQAYFEREEDAPVRYRDQAARDNTQREMESYINDSTRPNQTAQKKIDYSKLNF
jgi:hypothetical protein